MAIVIGPCWTNLATFGFNRMTLRDTQSKLYSMLSALFLKSRRVDVLWPPRSCDLTPVDYYLWGTVKDKCYADKPETIDALKENIRKAIGEIQLHTIDNVLKNLTDRVGYCMPSRGSHEWTSMNLTFKMDCIVVVKKKITCRQRKLRVFWYSSNSSQSIRVSIVLSIRSQNGSLITSNCLGLLSLSSMATIKLNWSICHFCLSTVLPIRSQKWQLNHFSLIVATLLKPTLLRIVIPK